MSNHTVGSFDSELRELERLVLNMGRSVLRQHEEGVLLHSKCDAERAQHIITGDRAIDEMQHTIEEKAIALIARRQPLAVDLRTIIATLKMATDLERVGDLVKNNAKRMLASSDQAQLPAITTSLDLLAARVGEQLGDVITALETRDDELAKQVWERDVEIDTQQTSLFRELLTYMMEDPRSIGTCTHLLFCSRNLERMGDHATNIAEQIHYIVTGKAMPLDRPKVDSASPDENPGM